MTRRCVLAVLGAVAMAACAHRPQAPATTPTQVQEVASAGTVDSLWARVDSLFQRRKWGDAAKLYERLVLEFAPGDPRIARARFNLAETYLAQGQQLQAAREFRRVSDEMPNDSLAPLALLRVGDAYAQLWRRPELDPSYGQTALATYQELLNRYPTSDPAEQARKRIAELQEKFAVKQYKAALYYLKFKAYDSAVLYLKDLVATYPKTSVAPQALVKLVRAYQKLDYQEDLRETCDYLHRFHPQAAGVSEVCPPTSTADK